MIRENFMDASGVNFQPVDFDPFGVEGIIEVPTTEAQREILVNVMFGGDNAKRAYNESVSLHLEGSFSFDALKTAIAGMIERHDALRSVFSEDGLRMIIHPSAVIPVEFIDLTVLQSEQAEARIKNVLDSEADAVFDLQKGPLGQIKLIRISKDKHQLVLTFHHIICDGWSLGILMQDLGRMYSAVIKGESLVQDPAPSFAEYAEDEIRFNESTSHTESENFWLNQYSGNIPQLDLPLNKPRPTIRTYNAQRIDQETDNEVIRTLKKIGSASGISYIAALTTAFEIFLYRITGSNDVVVGLAAAGQSAAGKYNLVGHCVNLLPLRSYVDPELSYRDYLKSRKSGILDAYDHQRYTFGSLVRKLNIPRDPARIPLVPVSFNVDLGITDGVSFEGCSFRFTTNPRKYENFEIFINAAGNGDELILECTFNTDLFTPEMIQLRLNEFTELLKSIAASPDKPLGLLNMITPWEKHKIFNEWQGVTKTFSSDKCIHNLIEKAAEENPDKTALVFVSKKISYSELNLAANAMAGVLSSKGVGPGILVGLLMERSPELIIAMLGILKAGGAYVPMDLTNPAERIRYILDDTKAPFLVTQKKLASGLSIPEDNLILIGDIDTTIANAQQENFSSGPDDLAYVIYTSGSTGQPKGVAIEHRSLVNYIEFCNHYYFGKKETGNFGLYSSISFDLTVTSIFCSLTRAKTLTIFKQDEEITDILKKSFGDETTVDCIKLTPAHVMLLESMEIKTGKIKKAIVGGEELLPRHVEILRSINPGMEIVNEYGPTEATVGCVIKDVDVPADASTIGKPIYNTEIYILDKNLQPVPPGITGNLFIGGAGLARYYHNRPGLSDEKFQILTLNEEGVRVYDSGDLSAYRINGDISFFGRIDNQVKIRGYRIELGEVEVAISELENVKEQVVTVREDVTGDKRIIAYLVLVDKSSANARQLRETLMQKLPAYMIPSDFVFLEKMPLTVNGKIDQKQLPSPGYSKVTTTADTREPQTPIEQVIANIWCDVLNVERAGRTDNFFELGGHSILGVKMLNEVEKQLGAKINLSMLFTASTIEELARLINKEGPVKPLSCLVPLQTKGSKPPLFCIHMHNGNVNRWRVMIKHLGNDQPVYAIQPRGLDIHQEPHRSIEEMADFYLDIIKSVQPHGPYHLIGLCFSGMVVYEMAARLRKKGEQVKFLGMVNNYAPPANSLQYRLQTGMHKFMQMKTSDKVSFAMNKTRSIVDNILVKAKLKTANNFHHVEEVQIDEAVEEIGHDLRTIHSLALLHYHPVIQYDGDLVIFRNSGPVEYPYNEYLGWDRLIHGKIQTHIIDGSDNDTIITDEPYNAVLSCLIRDYLNGKQA